MADTREEHDTLATPAFDAGGGPTLRPGECLAARYQVVRFIAQGGMGEVYEAEDTVLKERVALKTIRAEICA